MSVGSTDPVRDAALRILYDIETKASYSNLAMGSQLDNPAFSPLDRSFASQLVYGTLKWKLRIDRVIERFSDIRIKRLSPWILNILRMGAYQLIFMDKVPAYAVCSESVRLARKYGHSASASYVNAMMRRISVDYDDTDIPAMDAEPVRYLSVKYSYPEWIVGLWLEQFGTDFTEKLLEAGNFEPPFTIRLSCPSSDRRQIIALRDDTAGILGQDGIHAMPGRYADEALIIDEPSHFMATEHFRSGRFCIQDEAAMMVSKLLAPLPGEFVVDACGAPGGKTTHLAELMGGKGTVLARDIHPARLELIKGLAAKLGLKSIRCQVWDAVQYDPELAGKADRVLVDAPCSGLGILRRKPEIKWRRRPEDLKALAALQGRILDAASELVKPGGVLVYSTCTINRIENEDTVLQFVERNKTFRMTQDFIRMYPHIDGTDGFFMAHMVR